MTIFWAIVLSALTIYWSVRASRWARKADKETRKIHAEMAGELLELITQIETGKGPHDPGSGMAGDRA